MREILFRGKSMYNGEWVEGFYVCLDKKYHYILTGKLNLTNGHAEFEKDEVIPGTAGRYTGLTDKNGNKIFEGDIVSVYSHPDEVGDDFAIIRYDDEDAMFIIGFDTFCLNFGSCRGTDVEVIGNIHDNPELWSDEK